MDPGRRFRRRMVQPVTVFVDSTLLVEYNKNTRYELLEELFIGSFDLMYNQIVMSEYLYHFIGYHGTKSPRSLQESKSISRVLTENNPLSLLALFDQLTVKLPVSEEVIRIMRDHNMLSNDAMILAHCKSAGIHYLASYDSDFIIPCQEEGITLIDSMETFQRAFPLE